MEDSRKERRRTRQEDGQEIDRLYEALCRSLDGSALPGHLTEDAVTLAGRIDSHLHDMAATKQEYDPDAVRRSAALRHVLELAEDHLPDGLRSRLASFRHQEAQMEQRRAETEQRRADTEERWADFAGTSRPRMEGEPLEVIAARKGWKSNGWRELRLYAEGLELEAKRPKHIKAAAWVDIASFGTTPDRIGIRLKEGVPVTKVERFEHRIGHVHLNIPDVFSVPLGELAAKLQEYHQRHGG